LWAFGQDGVHGEAITGLSEQADERKALFKNDQDRRHLLELLEEMVAVYRVGSLTLPSLPLGERKRGKIQKIEDENEGRGRGREKEVKL